MAIYTELDRQDLERVCAAFGLGALRLSSPVPEGSINTNYRLETEGGRFFLRHTTVRSEADLRFEAALLGHLAQASYPAAVLLGFSPSLLYYTRFARHDGLMVLWELWMVVGVLRWLDSGRARWLYLTAAAIGLAIGTHELYYILFFIFGVFVAMRLIAESRFARYLSIGLGAVIGLCLVLMVLNPPLPIGRGLYFGEKAFLIASALGLAWLCQRLWDPRPLLTARLPAPMVATDPAKKEPSAEVASALGQALAERLTSKRYLALVRGWPTGDAGVIDHPLARDPELPSAGQPHLEAQTAWSCERRLELPVATDARFPTTRLALMACEPVQGRRHQIRRHLKHLAHPIVGDANHGKGPLNRALAAHFGLQRLWLHAQRLTLRHPVSGQTLQLEAEPGPEWAPFL